MALLDDIVAFYRFEGNLLDASGNGRSLTLTGVSTVDYPAGKIGLGVLPVLGWPRRIGDAAMNPAAGTISAWILFQSTSDTIVVGTDDENGNLVSGIKLFDDPPITLAGGGNFYETYDTPANGEWTHFVVSWGGAGFKCWINGTLFTEPVYTFSPGVDGEFGVITLFAQSRITDLLGVWSRQLTDGEVATLYGGGAGYDPYAPSPASGSVLAQPGGMPRVSALPSGGDGGG